MLKISFENVDNMEESKNTELGFEGDSGVIKNEKNSIIGFFKMEIEETKIYLLELEILDEYRNNGYGSEFINILFEKYPNIKEVYGLSLDTANGFYASIGADFYSSCENCTYIECVYNSLNENNEEDSSESVCDEYSDNYFSISKLLKK